MKSSLTLAFCLFQLFCSAQHELNSIYVCPPCHMECDGLEFNRAGSCPQCGMRLIQKMDLLKTEAFSFVFEGIRYSGEIGIPKDRVPQATIVIIPGHGRTDFVSGSQYYALRQYFTQLGFATLVWDKAGCGKSEGKYNHNQSVENSAQEALAAIKELKRKNISGSGKIGLWGISRAGWICPLIIKEDPSIAFWISVSGTDQFDNYRYMLATNFTIAGRSESEVKVLMNQWDHYVLTLRKGGESYEECKRNTKDLFNDPIFISLGGKMISEAEFNGAPEYYKNSGDIFDDQTGLQILAPEFERTLSAIQCPLLALFGELDSQVDWRKTNELYLKTISRRGKANLTSMIFPNCNHNIMKCETGGRFENLDKYNGEVCHGYYETMTSWLRKNKFAE